MSAKNQILRYTKEDKLSYVICDKYHLLLALNHFGIDMGFGEGSIEEVCLKHDVDTETFLEVINLLNCEYNQDCNCQNISLSTLIKYLRNSHDYFENYRLPDIQDKLMKAVCENNVLSQAVLNYFHEYVSEVKKHMRYEEDVVFDYVSKLIEGTAEQSFDIQDFSEHHNSVESKLSELKNIIIKYYDTKNTYELSSTLIDIFTCEKDLAYHSKIEDCLLIPAIKTQEKP